MTRLFSKGDEIYQALRQLEMERTEVRFLQIGAHDGMYCDPIREFIVRGKWRGCLVEPLPDIFTRLRFNYRYTGLELGGRLHFVNAAVGATHGKVVLHQISQKAAHKAPEFAPLLTTLHREHLLQHLHGEPNAEQLIETLEITCLTATEVLTISGMEELDLLAIDVEGHECQVFEGFPIEAIKPQMIIFESAHLSRSQSTQLSQLLHSHGYGLKIIGNDTVATRNSATA